MTGPCELVKTAIAKGQLQALLAVEDVVKMKFVLPCRAASAMAALALASGCATAPLPPDSNMLCDAEGGCTVLPGTPYGYPPGYAGYPGYGPAYGYGLFGFGSWWYSRPYGYGYSTRSTGPHVPPAIRHQGGTRSAPSTQSSPGRRMPAISGKRR